jgi:hypothetical protein
MERRQKDSANVIGYRHDRRRHARGLLALRERSAPRADIRYERRLTTEASVLLIDEK